MMWRIKQADANPPPQPAGEYWEDYTPEQAEGLDMAEIARLNRECADEEAQPLRPFRRLWLRAGLALLLILCFALWTWGDMLGLNMDFSLLKRSAELASDQALAGLRQAVVKIELPTGSGSGFNISPQGLIVTNLHVVEGGGPITITFMEGDERVFVAGGYTPIPGVDLALVDIDGQELPQVEVSPDPPQTMEEIIFIGNPMGYGWAISQGQLLGTMTVGDTEVYCFSGPVRPGSSGSPVFDSQARVIAIIFASLVEEENMGFAIPISYLNDYLITEEYE